MYVIFIASYYKKLLFSFLLPLFPVAILAQDKYHVVDAETGEALDGVCIYVTEGKGAWTNEDGDAELKIEDNEQVKISYIGYKTLVLKKSELEATVRLTPLSKDLREVSVESDELLLERLAKKLNKEANANRRHRVPFFSRITLQTNDGNEMIESFLEAGSAGIIHMLKLYTGLYYSLSASGRSASNLRRTNLHNIFCLGPNTENDLFWKGYVGPLHQGATAAWLKRNYQLSSEVYTNEDGEGLRCITVTPKNRTALIGGKIYLKPSSCDLVYFEGKMTADAVVYTGESSTVSNRTINFFINYTNRDGFAEVDNMTFVLTANGVKCRSVMINMEKHNVLEELTWPVEIGRNLVKSLDDTGYNHFMDKYLSIMARTDVEDALVNGNFSAMTEKEDGQQTTGDGQPTAKWKNALPQEKVYLHLDNTGYFKGETIWFKTYVVRTDTERRGNLSGVLYVDLVSPTGDVMAHKKIYVTHGIGAGSITLDNAVMPTGFYELRAYTRYMTNWSK
nr:carboxypeptidase-like regulatory domain-containing protein [Bacteroidaceae bacterium]